MLTVIALALSVPRIGTPAVYVFDELYYAYTAGKYVAGHSDAYRCCEPPRAQPAIEWTHPPVAKLLIGFFGQWLPWALSPRGTFIDHFLPAVPLGCIALAVVMADAWRAGDWRRPAAVGYGVAALLALLFFYPLRTAMPLTPEQVDARIWFASWR